MLLHRNAFAKQCHTNEESQRGDSQGLSTPLPQLSLSLLILNYYASSDVCCLSLPSSLLPLLYFQLFSNPIFCHQNISVSFQSPNFLIIVCRCMSPDIWFYKVTSEREYFCMPCSAGRTHSILKHHRQPAVFPWSNRVHLHLV